MEVEPLLRKLLVVLFLAFTFHPLSANQSLTDKELDATVREIIEFTESEVKARLQSLDQDLVEHRFDPAVVNAIKYYVATGGRRGAALIVGRATRYFPYFEKELLAQGLPMALMYLPIIESALRVDARSPVGAIGLWQFMPATATESGLRIDEFVDERLEPNRATEAALKYLVYQYEYFGDWALALAAYNAGRGRVNRALRRSKKKDFWSIRRYLPRETRNYVPAFIAATYLAEFFAQHEIEPTLPALDYQLTASIKLFRPCSFYRIAQITGLAIETIQELNPAYRKGYLPGYPEGHYLILPQRVMPAMQEYLNEFAAGQAEPPLPWMPFLSPVQLLEKNLSETDQTAYAEYVYATSEDGETLSEIACWLNSTEYHLAVWNQLVPNDSLAKDVALQYYQPRVFQHLPKPPPSLPVVFLPNISCSAADVAIKRMRNLPESAKACWQYCLPQKQRPSVVAAQYPHLNTADIIAENGIKGDRPLPAGSMLRIPRR